VELGLWSPLGPFTRYPEPSQASRHERLPELDQTAARCLEISGVQDLWNWGEAAMQLIGAQQFSSVALGEPINGGDRIVFVLVPTIVSAR